jgi:2-dehydropantoate 2-reductase
LICGHTPRDSIELRPDGEDPIVVPGPVHTDPVEVTGPIDVVVLAVKATQNDDAAGWLARLCEEHTIVAVLQNGVEQVEQVQPHCPSSPVIPGIVWYSAETVAELLRGAGCRVDCDPDFITAGWRKLLTNALAGFMALSGRRAGMFRRDDVAALSRRYLAECLAVARAEGARLPDSAVDELVNLFRQTPEDMGTSILADRESNRRMEWDLRNGVIIRKARAHNLATPISDVLVPLLAAASDGPG